MGKQPQAQLSAGLIATKGQAAPAPDMPTRAAPSAPPPVASAARDPGEALEGLNFKVTVNFRREFKTYAAAHGLKLNELLQRSFDAYRKQQGD